MKIEGYSWVRKPATATIMITEAFFLVAGFELEGYDEFIGSRCVVRAEQTAAKKTSHPHWLE